KEQDLGHAEKELSDLKIIYDEAREKYEKVSKIDADTTPARLAVDDIEISLKEEEGVAVEEVKDFIEKAKKDCRELLDKSSVAFEKYPQLRDANRSNYDNAVHLLETEVVDSINLRDLRNDFEKVFIEIWKDLIDVKNLEDQAVFDMKANEYVVSHGHKKAVKIYDMLELKMTDAQADLEEIGPKSGESVIAWTQRLTKFIFKNALNNSLS
ncbi:MAG: hypothetical protein Q7T51_04860, partial [Candidatus Moranbacteria bacterium]|nr:hypothetical protein [Candidatus Moranbacteria bacterium]